MTIEIKHAFMSAKGDGGDATLVRPSNWNAAHSTTMAAGNLLGRLTAGPGAFEEIPISAYMAALLASADSDALAAALGLFTTGDVKWSYDVTASTGWVVVNHATTFTIGSALSGATYANADARALWEMIYTNVTDTYAPVSGGRTGNATNDFNANKKLGIFLTGRSPIGAGTGASGITSRDAGQTGGAETHTLTTPEIPSHSHANTLNDPGHNHTVATNSIGGTGVASVDTGGTNTPAGGGAITLNPAFTGVTITNANAGGGTAHNNLHPYVTLYAHVKL